MNKPQYTDLKINGAVIATLAAGATVVTDAIPVGAFSPEGIYNLCASVSGADASLTVEPLINLKSPDDSSGEFMKDIDGYSVLNAFTETSGRAGDGKGCVRVVLGSCQGVKFELTNSGSAELTINQLGFAWQ